MDRALLADFLRARREALQPEDVGLPRGQRRRTGGLRREEVAALAGMSQESGHAQSRSDADPSPVVRLYTLDGGLTELDDASVFSDTGEYEGRSVKLPTPSYLIRHGDQWMIWDTGNGDRLASVPGGEVKFGGRFTQLRSLAGQLAELGLRPGDIDYVGISHLHQDHTGNISLFEDATFLISAAELAWARDNPTPFGVEAPSIAPLDAARLEPLEGDRDVFGDFAAMPAFPEYLD